MGYTGLKPADTQTIAQGPADIRDEIQGLATGQVVNAGTLKGYVPGNASGNIAVSNGTVCTGLNADKLDGNDASAFATAGHTHAAATTSSNGLMSNTDKTKLDGIAAGAEVNQNSFGNIAAGGVTIQADAKSDTLSFAAGTGVTLSGNATTDTVTITVTQDGHSHAAATTGAAGFMAAADKSKLDGIAAGAEVNQNAFSTVVAGGASIAADGKADTLTINAGSGITIAGDATNDALSIAVTPNGHTHSDASTGAAGFVTPAMVTKLNGIAAGAQTNQSAFSNVLVGGTTIAADAPTDTLELIAGPNIALTPNATNDSVTIGVTGTVAAAAYATSAGSAPANGGTATNATNLTGTAPICGYSQGGSVSYTGIGGPQIMGSASNAAMLSLHRAGAYAVNFGLDTDNQLKVGGWSMGNVSHTIMHSGNIGGQSVNYANSAGSAPANGGTATVSNWSARLAATGYAMGSYNVQATFDGARWFLRGYSGDTYYSECRVGKADYADSAGTVPNDSHTHTAATVPTTAYDAAHSFAKNGYERFSNGFMMQWGVITATGYGFASVTFPIAFPNACFIVLNTINNTSHASDIRGVYNITNIGAMIGYEEGARWFALGW